MINLYKLCLYYNEIAKKNQCLIIFFKELDFFDQFFYHSALSIQYSGNNVCCHTKNSIGKDIIYEKNRFEGQINF
jgi:hypothetical protein